MPTHGTVRNGVGFRPGTLIAQMYDILRDGKCHTISELHNKLRRKTSRRNIENAMLWTLRKRGRESGAFSIVSEPQNGRRTVRLVAAPTPPTPAREPSVSVTTIGEGGRIVLPAWMRAELGAKVGDQVLLQPEGQEIRIMTRAQALRKAQDLVRANIASGRSLVEELLQERRQEAQVE